MSERQIPLWGVVAGIAALALWTIVLLFWWSQSRVFGGWVQGSMWSVDVLVPPALFAALLASAIAYRFRDLGWPTTPRLALILLAALFALPALPALFISHRGNQSFEVFLEWRLGYVGTLAFFGLLPLLIVALVPRVSMALLLRGAACAVAAAYFISLGWVLISYLADGTGIGFVFPLAAVGIPAIMLAAILRLTEA